MTDIVERLRARFWHKGLFAEAADEIERLREALKRAEARYVLTLPPEPENKP